MAEPGPVTMLESAAATGESRLDARAAVDGPAAVVADKAAILSARLNAAGDTRSIEVSVLKLGAKGAVDDVNSAEEPRPALRTRGAAQLTLAAAMKAVKREAESAAARQARFAPAGDAAVLAQIAAGCSRTAIGL